MNQVLVHGGGGFVGSAILRALAGAPGLAPVAGVRRGPARPMAVPHRICDATDPRAVRQASRGATTAVNAVLGDAATMLAATRNICDAARATRMRVIHLSTLGVYGDRDGRIGETAVLDPSRAGPYGAAKIACEAVLRDFVADGGEAVILRPGIVCGPGGEQWAGRLGRLLRAGRLGDLGADGDGFCNIVAHDDVGAAVLASIDVADATGQTIDLAPETPPTWNDVLIRFARAIGATPVRRIAGRRLRLEGKLLAPPLQVAKLVASRFGLRHGALPEPVPPSLLRLFRQRLTLDTTLARSLLGRALVTPEAVLATSARWFVETHA